MYATAAKPTTSTNRCRTSATHHRDIAITLLRMAGRDSYAADLETTSQTGPVPDTRHDAITSASSGTLTPSQHPSSSISTALKHTNRRRPWCPYRICAALRSSRPQPRIVDDARIQDHHRSCVCARAYPLLPHHLRRGKSFSGSLDQRQLLHSRGASRSLLHPCIRLRRAGWQLHALRSQSSAGKCRLLLFGDPKRRNELTYRLHVLG